MTDAAPDATSPATLPPPHESAASAAVPVAPAPAAGGWLRLDPRSVTLGRLSGGIRAVVFTVIWAAASLIALVAGAPWGVWVGLGVFGAVVLAVGVLGLIWPRLEWKRASYRVGADGIEIRRGVWWRSQTTVPRSRVQHTDVTQGPLERSFGLGTLVLYTAGTDHSQVVLPGLAHDDASAIRDRLAAVDEDDAL